ncbi:hypothetical protein CFOL_v3_08735, partial [Cephalotus follicularis]
LPSDIIIDIFTRLPVKSLAQFKCVAKPIYALLHNPNFIKRHLDHKIHQDPNLILKLDSKLFAVEDEEWRKARRLQLPFAQSLEKLELSGSCNGLLCISDQLCNEDIFLYNPSTGSFNKLSFPEFDIPTSETTCFTALGFGYHHGGGDDYKVIRFVYHYDKPFVDIDSYECEARVYSLRNNTWKKTPDVPFHISSRAGLWLGNEFLVWKASRGFGRRMSTLVVCFDMEKEEFREIPQPKLQDNEDSHIELGKLGSWFCIYHVSRNEGVGIWSMMEFGVKESWAMLYFIGRPVIVDEYFMYLRPVTVLNTGEILVNKGEGELILYDPQGETYRDVNIRGATRRFVASAYVGSLVSPSS